MIAAAAYPKFLLKDFAAMDFSAEAGLRLALEECGVRSSRLLSGRLRTARLAQHRIQSLGELCFDVDVFVDGEVGALLRLLEPPARPATMMIGIPRSLACPSAR